MSETQSPPKINLISALLLCSLALVWGGAFFFGQITLENVPSVTVALHRVGWAVPALWIVLLLKGVKMPRSPHVWICFGIMGALNNAIPFSLILWGQTHIGSSLAAILNGTTAVFGAVVAAIFLSIEPLTLQKLMGALCVGGRLGKTALISPATDSERLWHAARQRSLVGTNCVFYRRRALCIVGCRGVDQLDCVIIVINSPSLNTLF